MANERAAPLGGGLELARPYPSFHKRQKSPEKKRIKIHRKIFDDLFLIKFIFQTSLPSLVD